MKNLFEEIGQFLLKNLEFGEDAEIRIERFKFTNIKVSDGSVNEIRSIKKMGVGIKLIKNGRISFASTTYIERNKLLDILDKARKILRFSITNEVYSPSGAVDYVESDYKIHHNKIPLEEKIFILEDINSKSFISANIKHASTWLGEMEHIKEFFSSTGGEIQTKLVSTAIRHSSFAKSKGKTEKLTNTKSDMKGFEFIYDENLVTFVEDVSLLTEKSLHAKDPPGGLQTVILDPKVLGLMLHEAFGHPAEADLIVSGNSVLRNRIGEVIANENINLVDSGRVKGGFFVPYDDEGVEKRDTYIIKDGVLNSFLHTRLTAKKCDHIPTGNARAEIAYRIPIARQTNLFIEKGDIQPEEILRDTKFGLYLQGIGTKGGHVDTSFGTFTLSVGPSFIIRNGEISEIVKGVNISGNIFDILKNVEGIGNDFSLHFNLFKGCRKDAQTVKVGFGGPHIKLGKVMVSGKSD